MGWDFAGSALASRNEQYERFYLTSGARNRQGAQLRANRTGANRLVERFLAEDALVDEIQRNDPSDLIH